jgi:hypothetical protein
MAAFVPKIVGRRFLFRDEGYGFANAVDPAHAAGSFAALAMAALSDAT